MDGDKMLSGYDRMANIALILALLLMTGGCAGRAGVEEFGAYSRAFDEAATVTEALLDRVAHAERRIAMEGKCRVAIKDQQIPKALASLCRDGRYPVAYFDPKDAIYFVESADPPFVAAQRTLVRTIMAYNRALAAYAEGKALAPYQAELERTAGELSLLLRAATGGAPSLVTAVKVVAQIFDPLIRASSEEAFRQLLLAHYPLVDQCLVALRDGRAAKIDHVDEINLGALSELAPKPSAAGQDVAAQGGAALMFALLTDDLSRQIELAAFGRAQGNSEALAKLAADREKTQKLIAAWSVMIDGIRAALRDAKQAIERPATALSTLRGGTAGLAGLRVSIETAKRALAGVGA
jgi:hypothetical protein